MLKGNMGIRIASGLMIGVILLGVVGFALSDGPLGSSIGQGLDIVEQTTTTTTQVDHLTTEDSKEAISDLARFVRHRAESCDEVIDQIDDGGYPGLEDTRLTSEPNCIGGEASAIRGGIGWRDFVPVIGDDPADNMMAGTLSREDFKIEGDPETDGPIRFSEGEGNVWLEEEGNIGGISYEGFESAVNFGLSNYRGTGSRFIIFFEDPEIADERTNADITEFGYDDSVWPDEDPKEKDGVPRDEYNHIVDLCPGDEGYIQLNRDEPGNTGITDEDFSDRASFPFIVIEDSEVEQCGDEMGGILPYEGLEWGTEVHMYEINSFHPTITQFHINRFEDAESTLGGYSGSNRCNIYMYGGDGFSADFLSDRFYKSGTVFSSNQDSISGLDFPYVDRYQESRPNRILGADNHPFDFDGEQISLEDDIGHNGELRERTTNFGYNEMYGDLLCANTQTHGDYDEYGQWNICLEEDSDVVEVQGHDFVCSQGSKDWVSFPNDIKDNWNDVEDEDMISEGSWGGEEYIQFDLGHDNNVPNFARWDESLIGGWSSISIDLRLMEGDVAIIGDSALESMPAVQFNRDMDGEEVIRLHSEDEDEVLEYNIDHSEEFTVVFSRTGNQFFVDDSDGNELIRHNSENMFKLTELELLENIEQDGIRTQISDITVTP